LFYSVKKREEAIFLKELEEIAKKKKNFHVIPFYTSEQGYINAEFITKKTRGNIKNKEIFLCGPLGMMEALNKEFKLRGISKNKIHFEEFSLR
jgi:predicted ferric reductase